MSQEKNIGSGGISINNPGKHEGADHGQEGEHPLAPLVHSTDGRGAKKAFYENRQFVEQFDGDRIKHLCTLKMRSEDERAIYGISMKLHKKKYAASGIHVQYKPGKSFAKGRVYGLHAQSLPGVYRRLACGHFYHDIDIVNCGPAILLQISQRTPGPPLHALEKYVNFRDKCFNEVRAVNRHLDTRQAVKRQFLIVLHGGSYLEAKPHSDYTELDPDDDGVRCRVKVPILDNLRKDISTLEGRLRIIEPYKTYYAQVKADPEKKNKLGTFISRCWQSHEILAIGALVEFADKQKRTVGVLCHDGVMIERKSELLLKENNKEYTYPDMDPIFLHSAEKYIKMKTCLDLKLVEKPMTPTAADWDVYYGPQSMHKTRCPVERAVYLLWRYARKHKYIRRNGYVMEPHDKIKGVYQISETYEDFVFRVLEENASKISKSMKFKDIMQWMTTKSHTRFRLVREGGMATAVISFLDGYFDINTLRFTPKAEMADPPLNDWYFDCNFPHDVDVGHWDEERNDKDTKMGHTDDWDNLLRTQLEVKEDATTNTRPNDIIRWMEILFGRLFYPANYDRWQVMPFIKGPADTGKSVVLNILTKMFPENSVGFFGGTQEKTFGLQDACGMRCNMIMDLPDNFHQKLDRGDFQSMVSGEKVSVAQKHMSKRNVMWKPTMVASGNKFFSYKDADGSIVRRCAVFKFATLLGGRRDLGLQSRIEEPSQLAHALIRCIKSYRAKKMETGTLGFWDCAPRQLIVAKEEIRNSTNHFADFLNNGNRHLQVIEKDGAVTTRLRLAEVFHRHMKDNHKKDVSKKLGMYDMETIEKLFPDVKLLKKNVCTICKRVSNKKTCKSHYSVKNRNNSHVFVGLWIHRKTYNYDFSDSMDRLDKDDIKDEDEEGKVEPADERNRKRKLGMGDFLQLRASKQPCTREQTSQLIQ